MTRRRTKKRRANNPLPALQHQVHPTSQAAKIVANRIANGGVEYLVENLYHIMTDSVQLADEPEFIDLALDRDKIVEITQRWLKKFEKRLDAAERKGEDEYDEVFGDMRIEVINDLVTPAFRRDVDERLQALLDRLMATNDLEKLEMVILLKPFLDMKDFPWGLCGLILEIYNRAVNQAMQEYEEDQEILEAVTEALKAEGEETIDFEKIMEAPEKLDRAGQKLIGENPGLRQNLEKRAWDMADAFEKELSNGNVALKLFSEEELLIPFQHIQEELGEAFTQTQPTDEIRLYVFDAIVQAINDIMTPERFQLLHKDVESAAKAWLRERQKWAAALQVELGWLEGEKYEENTFIIAAFIGQLSRAGKEQKSAPKPKKRRH